MPIDDATLEAIDSMFPERDWVEAMEDEEALRSRLDVLRRLAAEDLEIAMIGPGGFAGSFSGIDGFESAWRDWLAPFDSYRIEQEEDHLIGDEVAVFFARQIATPKGTTTPMENDGASVWFFRDGRVRRIEFHLERASALKSAGLD